MIDIKQFLSEACEVHALVIGIGEILPPWKPLFTKLSKQGLKDLRNEYHYYMLGRITGFAVLISIIIVAIKC